VVLKPATKLIIFASFLRHFRVIFDVGGIGFFEAGLLFILFVPILVPGIGSVP
jgi:hypothetical protein